MKYAALILILSIALYSCSVSDTQNPTFEISEEERIAMNKVTEFYEGTINAKKGVDNVSSDPENYFEMEVKSNNIEILGYSKLTSSNIAYLFYSNLDSSKVKYDKIRVILDHGIEGKENFDIATAEIEEVSQVIEILYISLNEIYNDSYEPLLESFDESAKEHMTVDNLSSSFYTEKSILEEDDGEFNLIGYRMHFDKDLDANTVQLIGMFLGGEQSSPFAMTFNLATKKIIRIDNSLRFSLFENLL